MAAVELRSVQKTYPGGVQAVRGLSLEVRDGELLVLVGPSGCGKSTVLRMLAGLESVTSGEILIGGRVVNDVPPQQRNVAMVFQNYALYPHKTVRGNLEFPLRMMKVPRTQRKQRVDEVSRVLGLVELLDQYPRSLSGGQRQRVAMGRAMVRQPQVFLLDEPLSNLDAKLRVQIRTEIAALQKQLSTTMIYVTHDQVEAMTLGDRVAVLNQGRLQQLDSGEALYRHPANVFVAGFIGSPGMNIFETTLGRGQSGEWQIDVAGAPLALPLELTSRLPHLDRYSGKTVLAGLRPEAFSLEKTGEFSAPLRAKTTAVEILGHENILYLDSPLRLVPAMPHSAGATSSRDGGTTTGGYSDAASSDSVSADAAASGTALTARLRGGSPLPRRGEEVELFIDSQRLCLFDRDDGRALDAPSPAAGSGGNTPSSVRQL